MKFESFYLISQITVESNFVAVIWDFMKRCENVINHIDNHIQISIGNVKNVKPIKLDQLLTVDTQDE